MEKQGGSAWTRWQPISVHRAILAGATPAQVSEAAGASLRDVHERWQKRADVQRHCMIGGRPGRGGLPAPPKAGAATALDQATEDGEKRQSRTLPDTTRSGLREPTPNAPGGGA